MSTLFPRFHIGLHVSAIEPAIAFYEKLFAMAPTKVRPGYAKFEVEQPSVNFSLNQGSVNPAQKGALSHIGIQVDSQDQLRAQLQRCGDLGLVAQEEQGTTCCFALQDKFWVHDPDGNPIEFFLVLEKDVAMQPRDAATCCAAEAKEHAVACC